MKKFEFQDTRLEYLLLKLDRIYHCIVSDANILKEVLTELPDNQLDDFRFTSQVGLVHERWNQYFDLYHLVEELIEVSIKKGNIRNVELYRDSDNKHYLVELDE